MLKKKGAKSPATLATELGLDKLRNRQYVLYLSPISHYPIIISDNDNNIDIYIYMCRVCV
jgi:hypothetical protein